MRSSFLKHVHARLKATTEYKVWVEAQRTVITLAVDCAYLEKNPVRSLERSQALLYAFNIIAVKALMVLLIIQDRYIKCLDDGKVEWFGEACKRMLREI